MCRPVSSCLAILAAASSVCLCAPPLSSVAKPAKNGICITANGACFDEQPFANITTVYNQYGCDEKCYEDSRCLWCVLRSFKTDTQSTHTHGKKIKPGKAKKERS